MAARSTCGEGPRRAPSATERKPPRCSPARQQNVRPSHRTHWRNPLSRCPRQPRPETSSCLLAVLLSFTNECSGRRSRKEQRMGDKKRNRAFSVLLLFLFFVSMLWSNVTLRSVSHCWPTSRPTTNSQDQPQRAEAEAEDLAGKQPAQRSCVAWVCAGMMMMMMMMMKASAPTRRRRSGSD